MTGGSAGDGPVGLDGIDVLSGAGGADWMVAELGTDTAYGGDGDVRGGDVGDDLLFGGAGTDALWGSDGADTISAGAGDGDSAFGGAGAYTFVLATGGGWDALADWDDGLDRIDAQVFDYADFAAMLAAGGFVSDSGSGERLALVGFGSAAPGVRLTISLGAGEALDATDFLF